MNLCASQRQLLTVLADGRLYSYRCLTLATGKYSNLHGELRHRSPRGLGSKGFVREDALTLADMGIPGSTDKVYVFQTTAAGCAAIGVPVPALLADRPAAEAEFAARYREFYRQYCEEESLAQTLGLSRHNYVLLRTLASDPRREWTYAELARATGLFSGLPQSLRFRHARHRSLASLGLCRETIVDLDDGRSKHAFQATAAGLALLQGQHAITKPSRKAIRRLAPPLPCGDEE